MSSNDQVYTYIAESPIAGIGCFADQNLISGQIVYRWYNQSRQIFTEEQILRMPPNRQKDLYYKLFINKVTKKLCAFEGNWQFINNSDDNPNLEITYENIPGYFTAYAMRDIRKDEELLWRYTDFDEIDLSEDNIFFKLRKILGIEPDEYDKQVEGTK